MKFSDAPRHRFSTESVLSILTLIVVGVICLTFQHLNLKKKAAVKSAALPLHHVVIKGQVQHKNGVDPTTQLMADEDIKEIAPAPHVQGNVSTVD
jgi:hypothetical protein